MEGRTLDAFDGDFPPSCYGHTPRDVEETCSQVIERIFRDGDGMIRSGVHGWTMKPITLEQIAKRGGGKDPSDMPAQLKPIWLNYEDTCMATGRYLVALSEKFACTQDKRAAAAANQSFDAIVKLWTNGADQPEGRGWMPKPYGGITDIAGIHETSPDQYGDLTLGLESFHHHIADASQKACVEQMICSFADWWIDHDWTLTYLGRTLDVSAHVRIHTVAIMLYLSALAYRYRALERYSASMQFWMDRCDHLFRHKFQQSDVAGQALECTARLIDLWPEHQPLWRKAVEVSAHDVARCIETDGTRAWEWEHEPYQIQMMHKAAHYLSVAHAVVSDAGFGRRARLALEHCNQRCQFYCIARDVPLAALDPLVAGDDYRDVFYASNHASWLCAYWTLRRQNEL